MSTRVAVIGCTGRMGQELVRLVTTADDLVLAGAVTRPDDPLLGRDAGVAAQAGETGVSIAAELPGEVDVAVDFTLPDACVRWAHTCADRGIPFVSGTTGLDESQHATLREASGRAPVLWAPNMSVGVNVLLRLVREAATVLDATWDVEISESHHRAKVDAPSGTARALVEAVRAGRAHARSAGGAVQRSPNPPGECAGESVVHGRQGACGPRADGEIGVHALRLGGIPGDHEVSFGSPGEVVTLAHRALSREIFARGALLAVRWIVGRAPGLYHMQDLFRGDPQSPGR